MALARLLREAGTEETALSRESLEAELTSGRFFWLDLHGPDRAELPGMNPEAERYFRDVYDHLFRLAELIDGLRDLMTSAVDVDLSASANRRGGVTKQLTVIATIFLPLTFVAGFFGQNFEWMTDHVASGVAFLVFGVGLQLLAIGALFAYFKRQGWF